MPGYTVVHDLLEFAQIHVHSVSDATQPSHSLPHSFFFSRVCLDGLCKATGSPRSELGPNGKLERTGILFEIPLLSHDGLFWLCVCVCVCVFSCLFSGDISNGLNFSQLLF